MSGKIGDLFSEDVYLNLPDVVPVASIQLATTLLRANGVEPRPEVTSFTIKAVIHYMKKFLCVFAWNILSPDRVTSECSTQMLLILQKCLTAEMQALQSDQTFRPQDSLRMSPDVPAREPVRKCTLPLCRCMEILRENFGIGNFTAPKEVIREILDQLADNEIKSKCNDMQSLLEKARYLVEEATGIVE